MVKVDVYPYQLNAVRERMVADAGDDELKALIRAAPDADIVYMALAAYETHFDDLSIAPMLAGCFRGGM